MKLILAKKRRRSVKGRRRVYRIWYGDEIVYVGKTSQHGIGSVLRRHFFSPTKVFPEIDVLKVTKVEEQDHASMADCAVYVTYYINKWKPRFNSGRCEKDELHISLPLVKWNELEPVYMDEWKEEKQLIQEGKREELKRRRVEWQRRRLLDRMTWTDEEDK